MKHFLLLLVCSFFLSIPLGYSASVTIPSNEAIVGLSPSLDYEREHTLQSWAPLPEYTQQTLENFENGSARGALCVHSYEISFDNAIKHFREKWNTSHPNDQRRFFAKQKYSDLFEDFFNVFTAQEFVDHYIEYVLADRPLISTSLLSFHDEKVYTNFSTFGPVNLIFSAPHQCITFTSYADSYTPFDYWNQRPSSNELEKYTTYLNSTLSPLDSIMRFSNVERDYLKPGKSYYPVMNEIGVLSCARVIGEFYRPSVVGILINPHKLPTPPSDLGNSKHNKLLEGAARTWATQNGLLILDLKDVEPAFFTENELSSPENEWITMQNCMPSTPYIKRHDLRKRDLSTENFRLTAEQLKEYGLNPPSIL